MLRCRGKVILSKALSSLLLLACYLTSTLLIIGQQKQGGMTDAFPLSKRLLDDLGDDNNMRGLSPSASFVDPTATAANSRRAAAAEEESRLQSRFRHYRLRHERRRINRLKEALVYLRKFGYLLDKQELNEETVQAALKSVQQVLGVRTSGELDRYTIYGMRQPRCGNSDLEQSAIATPSRRIRRLRRRFAQMSRWLNKMDDQDVLHLQWYIEKYTKDIPRDSIRDVIKRAFKLWSDQVSIQSMRTLKLDFAEASSASQSDISIMWAEGEHGDAYPFDGAGNTTNILAHTFYPNYQETGSLNGDIHFDDYETWVLDDASEEEAGVRFPYVLVHEIGHALGLGHSRRQEAVMNPIYKQTPLNQVTLDIDDKCAVNWNYIGPTRTCLFIWLLIEYLPRAQETNTSHGFGTPPNGSLSGPGSFYSHVVGEQALEDRVRRTLDNFQRVHIPRCTPENNLQRDYETVLMQKLEFPPESAQRYAPVVCNFLDGLSDMVSQQRRRSSSSTNTDSSSNSMDVRISSNSAEQQEWLDAAIRSSANSASDSDSSSPAAASGPAELSRPAALLVHSYSSGPYASHRYNQFHSDSDSDSDDYSDSFSSAQQQQRNFVVSSDSGGVVDSDAPDSGVDSGAPDSGVGPDSSVESIYSREYFDQAFFDRLLRLVLSKHG